MYLRTFGSLQITKKDGVRKSQIRKVSHLRKFRKCNKLFHSASLLIYDLRNLFANRPPLLFRQTRWSF
jgi:hypothetical protein